MMSVLITPVAMQFIIALAVHSLPAETQKEGVNVLPECYLVDTIQAYLRTIGTNQIKTRPLQMTLTNIRLLLTLLTSVSPSTRFLAGTAH